MYRFQKPMQKCLKSTVIWWTSFRIYLKVYGSHPHVEVYGKFMDCFVTDSRGKCDLLSVNH